MIAYLGLGSNRFPRKQWISEAIERLKTQTGIELLRIASLYRTPALVESVVSRDEPDPSNIPDFLNTVAEVETSLEADDLLKTIQQIEKEFGRSRATEGTPKTATGKKPFLSRNIDIDILFYGDCVIDSEQLKVPHPDAHFRSFVLLPMRELNPGFAHPKLGKTVEQLCREKMQPVSINLQLGEETEDSL